MENADAFSVALWFRPKGSAPSGDSVQTIFAIAFNGFDLSQSLILGSSDSYFVVMDYIDSNKSIIVRFPDSTNIILSPEGAISQSNYDWLSAIHCF